MYRFLLILLVSFSLVVLSGCNEEAPIESIDSNNAQTLSKAPASSGVVVRIEGFGDWMLWDDPNTGLVLMIGHPDVAPNRGVPFNCDYEGQEFDLKYITSPSNEDGARFIATLMAKDAFVSIWEGTRPFATRDEFDFIISWDEYCNLINSAPVATGNVKASYNDNDVNGSVVNNANSYKFSANGKVFGADGKSYNLNAFWNGSYNAKNSHDKKQIKLTARGKK